MNKKEKLLEKIEKDAKEIENRYLEKDKIEIYNRAWEIATYHQFEEVLTWELEEFEEEDIDNIDFMLEYKDNLLEFFKNGWGQFRHPERYNFWYDYDSCLEIINIIIEELGDKQ